MPPPALLFKFTQIGMKLGFQCGVINDNNNNNNNNNNEVTTRRNKE